ncbi:hypothetical protein EON65_33450 [archaeon]|nr:MAG: hypothetical protein EON65_33450 [archaeon]
MQRLPSVFQVPKRGSNTAAVTTSSQDANTPPPAVASTAPVAAAPLSSAVTPAPPRKMPGKKLSIFSRRASIREDSADSFGGGKKLKYKEADVKTIMNMGFSRDQAVWALMQSENNVVNAIMSLTG